MKVTNDKELAYVMDFYQLKEFPIYCQGYNVGTMVRDKDVNVIYKKGSWKYLKDWHYAHQLAYQQINDVVDLVKKLNEKTSVVAIYHWDETTWEYADADGVVRHHVYPHTIKHEKEEVWDGTYDEVFEKLEEHNRHLRYCNGLHYTFKDEQMNHLHNIWYNIISEGRKFNLYYGDGIVD